MKALWIIPLILPITLANNTSLAQSANLEQRINELEMRVKALEAQAVRNPSSGWTERASQGFSGQYAELNSPANRRIRFEPNGGFTLTTKTGQFKGKWQQSGTKLSIQTSAGFAEEFRISGDTIVDSRNIQWIKAKGE